LLLDVIAYKHGNLLSRLIMPLAICDIGSWRGQRPRVAEYVTRDQRLPVGRPRRRGYCCLRSRRTISRAGAEPDAFAKRHVERAAAWCRYLEGHARRLYATVTDRVRVAAALLASRVVTILGSVREARSAYRRSGL
jgi:hypothetical protein